MTWNRMPSVALPLLTCLALAGASTRAADTPETVPEWRFPVGVTFVGGFQDVVDYHEARFGEPVDFAIPAGVQFEPYLQYDNGSRVEVNVGPTIWLLSQVSVVEGLTVTEKNFAYFEIPIGAAYGFTFLPHASTSPYVSAGFRYHIVMGNFAGSSSPGAFGAIGVEMARKNRVGFGLELGFDGSTVTLKRATTDVSGNPIDVPEQRVKTNDVTFSFRVVF